MDKNPEIAFCTSMTGFPSCIWFGSRPSAGWRGDHHVLQEGFPCRSPQGLQVIKDMDGGLGDDPVYMAARGQFLVIYLVFNAIFSYE